MNLDAVIQAAGQWLATHLLRLIFIAVIAVVLLRLSRGLSMRLFTLLQGETLEGERKKRAVTLSSLIRYVLNTAILVVVVGMVLGQFGVDIGPVLAAAGIVGVAIGFGAQHLVRDVISGFFILLEDQVRIGDVVEVAGKCGLVESVNLRMTVLRDVAGNVHYVRNGSIDVVTNMTKEFSYAVFDVGVAYRENVDEVIGVIREVADQLSRDETWRDDILEPVEILGLDRFAESSMVIKTRMKTRPSRQWTVGREFNRRLKLAFDARRIEIPFPHVTVYMGADRAGSAAIKHDRTA